MSLPYSLEQDLFARKNQALALMHQGASVDAMTVSRLLNISNTWTDLKPGAALPFAMAGYDSTSPQVRQAAQLSMAQNVNQQDWFKHLGTVDNTTPAPKTPRLKQYSPDDINKQEKAQHPDPEFVVQALLPKWAKLQDRIQRGDVSSKQLDTNTRLEKGLQYAALQLDDHHLSAIADELGLSGSAKKALQTVASTGRQEHDLGGADISGIPYAGPALGAFRDAIKPAVREAATVANAPLQGLQGSIRNIAGGGNFLFSSSGATAGQQTDIGQQFDNLLNDKTLDIGNGYLPDPRSPVAQQTLAVQKAAAPTIGGHAFTLGRATANQIFEPDTNAFNVLSGIVDAGVALKGDPTAALVGALGDVRQAGKTFEPQTINPIAEATGAMPTTTAPAVVQNTKLNYLMGDDFKSTASKLMDVAQGSQSRMMRVINNSNLAAPTFPITTVHGQPLIADLAEASKTGDLEAFRTALAKATEVQAPLRAPGVTYNFRQGADTRIFANMPIGTIADPYDKNANWKILDDVMRGGNVPIVDRDKALDVYLNDPNPMAGIHAVSDTIEQRLIHRYGIDPKEAHIKASFFRDANTTARAYDIDQSTGLERVRPGIGIAGEAHPIPAPSLLTEGLNSPIVIPDMRVLRRTASDMNFITNTKPWEVSQTMLAFPSQVWKAVTLPSVRMMTRIMGESQLNLATRGSINAFTSPLDFINLLIGTNQDKRWATFLEKLPGLNASHFLSADGRQILDDSDNLLMHSASFIHDPETIATKGFFGVPPTHPDAGSALVEQLGRMHGDPIMRGVAQAENPEAAKDWFWGAKQVEHTGDYMASGNRTAENLPELFHGSSTRFAAGTGPEVGVGSGANNLMGPGFYATDDLDVARTYMQKGRGVEPAVHSLQWQGSQAPRVLDAEQPMSDAVKSTVADWWTTQVDHPHAPLDMTEESAASVQAALDSNAPLSTTIREIRKAIASTGEVTRADANEYMDSLAYRLEDHADALRYSGGVRTGNKSHNAYVFLDPSQVGVSESPRGTRTVEEAVEGNGKELRLARAPITANQDAWGANQLGAGKLTDYKAVGDLVNDRTAADRYIDEVMYPKLVDMTGHGHPELLDAVRTGKLNGRNMYDLSGGSNLGVVDDKSAEYAKSLLDSGAGPRNSIPLRETIHSNVGVKAGHYARVAMDGLFHGLVDVPDKVFDRQPTLAPLKWGYVERNAPYLRDQDELNQVIDMAEKVNLPKDQLARFRAIKLDETASQRLTTGQLTHLSKVYASDEARHVLHDLTSRSQFFDMVRWLIPFGDAFRLIAGRMLKLVADEPQVIRRLQQGLQEAKQPGSATINRALGDPIDPNEGFFHTDPRTGEQVWTFPGSGIVTNGILDTATGAGVPIPLQGQVQGLNMLAEGYPGFGGPALTIGAKWFLPDTPTGKAIKDVVFPYGNSESQGLAADIGGAFIPSFLGKLAEGAPNVKAMASTTMWMMRALASTGEYDLHDPQDVARLAKDAKNDARWAYVIQGGAQFLSPGAPSFDWRAKDKDGRWARAYALTNAYQKHVSKDGPSKAMQWLINTMGTDNVFISQGSSQSTGYRIPATKEAQAFVDAHPGIADKFPLTYGLLAPQTGTYDPHAEDEQFTKGERRALTGKEMVAQAEQRLGYLAYDRKKQQILDNNSKAGEPGITQAQTRWLADFRTYLGKEFPGFGTYLASPFDTQKRRDAAILELQSAVKDKTLAGTDAGKGLTQFLGLRDKAIASAKAGGLATPWQAKSARGIRDWLRDGAAWVMQHHPDFAPMWNQIFEHELTVDPKASTP